MSYVDQGMSPGRVWSIVAVAILHALLGYAFVTGLAYKFVKSVQEDLKTFDVQEPPPPEEEPPPPPPEQARPPPPVDRAAADRPDERHADRRSCRRPSRRRRCRRRLPAPPAPPAPPPPPPRTVEPARASANLASYVSDDDYPASALRSEDEGTTGFRLTVGPDGRVTNCTVTSSSGSTALDTATCRILRSRARFTPARDNTGQPTTDTRQPAASRWRIAGSMIEVRLSPRHLHEKELTQWQHQQQLRSARRGRSVRLHRQPLRAGRRHRLGDLRCILVIMSVGSWYVFFVKLIEQQKIIKEGRRARTSFWQSANLREGANKLDKNGAYRQIVDDGLIAQEQHTKLTDPIDQHDWMLGSLARSQGAITSKLSTGLALLATVGSTAPFVGLFGTVVGIYRALIKHRRRRPGVDRHRRRPGRRGADHDRARPRRRGSGGHAVQLADAPQQGDRRGARPLRQRRPRLHDVGRRGPSGRRDRASGRRRRRPAGGRGPRPPAPPAPRRTGQKA